MRRVAAVALLLPVLLVMPRPANAGAPPVRFVVVGDQGAVNDAQASVAAAMAQVCNQKGCDFVLGTGDNFYSTTNGPWSEYAPEFVTHFEEPFAAVDAPFLMTLGNHDQGLDVIYPLADAQVRYSYRKDRVSEKWRMPFRWYQHDQGDAAFFALDTSTLTSDGRASVVLPGALGLPTAPRDSPDPYQDLYRQPQLRWLQDALGESGARWKIAVGHHPYTSNGDHGDAPADYARTIEDSLCGKVDVFFAGHDHHLEWLEPVAECPDTQLLISGAGSLPRAVEDRRPAYFKVGNTPGFIWAEIKGDVFTAEFYDGRGEQLYRRSHVRHREDDHA